MQLLTTHRVNHFKYLALPALLASLAATGFAEKPKQEKVRPEIFAEKPTSVPAMDARWAGYGDYVKRFVTAIQVRFDKLVSETPAPPPAGTWVAVKFRIEATGAVSEIVNIKSTAGNQAALLCTSAITSSAPFEKWSDDMIATLGNSQEMTFKFYFGAQ